VLASENQVRVVNLPLSSRNGSQESVRQGAVAAFLTLAFSL